MSQIQRSSKILARPVFPRLYSRPTSPASVRWRINGYATHLLIWSKEEWEHLAERPADAQRHPSGVWCALRLG
jgi:hypothetical protein